MNKQFYCKFCEGMKEFISHADLPNQWVCRTCQTRTSNPITKPKMPGINKRKIGMDLFWEKMAEKSCENKSMGVKKCQV